MLWTLIKWGSILLFIFGVSIACLLICVCSCCLCCVCWKIYYRYTKGGIALLVEFFGHVKKVKNVKKVRKKGILEFVETYLQNQKYISFVKNDENRIFEVLQDEFLNDCLSYNENINIIVKQKWFIKEWDTYKSTIIKMVEKRIKELSGKKQA
jgi:hypothetical protein